MKPETDYKEELETLRREFEEFAYIISHDLKAPIRAITNLISWIEEDLGENKSEDVQQNMKLLHSRSYRLERMIEALLQYSRVTRYDLEVIQTDVLKLVQDLARNPGPGDTVLKLHTPGPLPVLETYGAKLRQVFGHLLRNATMFSNKPETEVTITARKTENFYQFEVSDNGGGIQDEALDKIFRMFYTVAPKDKLDTVGAGLAITKKIIEFVEGTITAARNSQGGLTIRFTWPETITTAASA